MHVYYNNIQITSLKPLGQSQILYEASIGRGGGEGGNVYINYQGPYMVKTLQNPQVLRGVVGRNMVTGKPLRSESAQKMCFQVKPSILS